MATLYGQVIDGTRCYGDDDNNQDVCVGGECKVGMRNKASFAHAHVYFLLDKGHQQTFMRL